MLHTHGVTPSTLDTIMLGAGVFYKNLKWVPERNDWEGIVVGATTGGGTVNYEPEYLDVEVDGATVAVKGLTKQKVGESATISMNLTEVKENIVAEVLNLEEDETKSTDAYTCYKTKLNIDKDDYLENVAFVGTTCDGSHVIIILPNAVCVSAFQLSGNNKTQATYSIEYICTAELTPNLMQLPIEIYFPVKSI